MGGVCDYFAKNYVSSDTLEIEVIEQEVVKVKTETEKRMYCNETIHHYLNCVPSQVLKFTVNIWLLHFIL